MGYQDIPVINIGSVVGTLPAANRYVNFVGVGAASTATGTLSTAAYSAFTNNSPYVQFTAIFTGIIEVFGTFTISNTASATDSLLIVATTGGPTTLFNQETFVDSIAATNVRQSASVYGLFNVITGNTYGFQLQGKTAGGVGTLSLLNSGASSGHNLVAIQVS